MPTITTPISRANRATRNESSSIIGSVRDSGMVSKQWIKDKRDSDNQFAATNALSKLQSDVAKIRRVKAGGYMPQDVEPIFPFKIYQMGANNQFQVRGGYIGYRGNYLLPSTTLAGTRNNYNANNELILFGCGTDTQGTFQSGNAYDGYISPSLTSFYDALEQNSGTPITIDAVTQIDTPVLICSNQPSTPNPLGASVILENSDNTGGYLFFWIVIKDSETDGPYTELWAGYSDYFSSLTRDSVTSFPDYADDNLYEVIPVGCIKGGDFTISQWQSGNLLNRYTLQSHKATQLANASDSVFYNMPQRFRGKWTADLNDGTPTSVLVFVGDIVVDDRYNSSVTGIGNVRMGYIRLPDNSGNSIFNDVATGPSSAYGTANVNWSKFMVQPY